MILKKVTLNNIRSYTNETIEFPEGAVLLSGDIGAGKSTVLLAIEFALFGILKGELSGTALLRHGARDGFVELTFTLHSKDITIRRTLKRSAHTIEQDTGHIIIDDELEKLTPLELKAKIITLLNYPQDTITKGKNYLFRYTIYTPQEEMKHILFDDDDARLDVLRKLFDMEKYKRAQENTTLYTKSLREEIRFLEGKLSDKDIKKLQRDAWKKEITTLTAIEANLQQVVHKKKESYVTAKNILARFEEQQHTLSQLQNTHGVLTTKLDHTLRREKELADELARAQQQTRTLENELAVMPTMHIEPIKKSIREHNEHITRTEEQLFTLQKELTTHKIRAEEAHESKEKIASLATCPKCLQQVSTQHKQNIIDREDEIILACTRHVAELETQHAELKQKLKQYKDAREKLREDEHNAGIRDIKTKQLNDYRTHVQHITSTRIALGDEKKLIENELSTVHEQLQSFTLFQTSMQESRHVVDVCEQELRTAEIDASTHAQKHQLLARELERLEHELQEKQQAQQQKEHLAALQFWLEEYFTKVLSTIEKEVMAKIWTEFNEIFQEWFNMLVEDEVLSARLDDTFSPIIEQNGYDVELANLSGGEKTACALAYRLSLNKVINTLLSDINTQDLIILDEPTDGFSAHQLDRVRDVLNALGVKQTIIVSHESKIESFVDNVIRITKHEHVSAVHDA